MRSTVWEEERAAVQVSVVLMSLCILPYGTLDASPIPHPSSPGATLFLGVYVVVDTVISDHRFFYAFARPAVTFFFCAVRDLPCISCVYSYQRESVVVTVVLFLYARTTAALLRH